MPTQILFIQGAGETTHDAWDNKLVDSLARDRAEASGEPEVQVRPTPNDPRHQTVPSAADTSDLSTALLQISRDYRQLPSLDRRTDDEIVGYDEHGLPA